MLGLKSVFRTHKVQNKWTKTFFFMEIVFLLILYFNIFKKNKRYSSCCKLTPIIFVKPKIIILKNMYNSWIMKSYKFCVSCCLIMGFFYTGQRHTCFRPPNYDLIWNFNFITIIFLNYKNPLFKYKDFRTIKKIWIWNWNTGCPQYEENIQQLQIENMTLICTIWFRWPLVGSLALIALKFNNNLWTGEEKTGTKHTTIAIYMPHLLGQVKEIEM